MQIYNRHAAAAKQTRICAQHNLLMKPHPRGLFPRWASAITKSGHHRRTAPSPDPSPWVCSAATPSSPLSRRCRTATPSRGVARTFGSGRYAIEISCDGMVQWLRTFTTLELATWAYDIVAWTYHWLKSKLNFPDVTSWEVAEFLAPELRTVSQGGEGRPPRHAATLRP